ncbi:Asparaginase/glutaminase [Basidiobolus meristosporus CBS 931.73]|uniref:asparaginase n=1 Tax=Basidiobolus meristosporus CBS 931.73 TaxID=1314790 RepID=A0A1Y1YIL5_9FUNG|nr:Asparaginase/glutaminase [Basidiobolus meristosporus CBS 931.73]|eukprot:ORX97887.1 Asparaginase/glutaminase [Basidiobolus meristosporus CBS 931.73]
MSAPNLLVVVTGGTIFQKVDANGEMQLAVSISELLTSLGKHISGDVCPLVVDLNCRSGAELTFETILRARDAFLENLPENGISSAILVTGTDTMEEFAFCLDLCLGPWLIERKYSLVITGSMKPADVLGYDGHSNVLGAIQVALGENAKRAGVLLSINNDIHSALYVTKGDSQLIGSFRSVPTGPIGQIRRGIPQFYYSPAASPPPIYCPSFLHLDQESVAKVRVAIWIITVSSFIPEQLLENLDGLVLAGPGTGSIPNAFVEQLSPKWTKRIPIVVVTRCFSGNNFDDHYYRGSKAKFTSKGFILEDGFEDLNAIQARNLLTFKLAARA